MNQYRKAKKGELAYCGVCKSGFFEELSKEYADPRFVFIEWICKKCKSKYVEYFESTAHALFYNGRRKK